MARTGLRMMPTFPLSPLRFRTAGFPQYGSKAGMSDGAFSDRNPVKPAPGIPITRRRFAPIPRALRSSDIVTVLCRRLPALLSTAIRTTYVALPQGPSLRSGLYCPGPSTLNRPHPTHSPAHRNFTARRFICNAFAVRERLGDPRVVPRFHLPFLPSMSPSMSPGRLSLHIPSSFATSADLHREIPTVRPLPTSTLSGLTDSRSLQPAELLASLSEAFTSGLSAVRSPSPPPDITTVSTGQSPPTGLSPARMAASVAARSPGSRNKERPRMPGSQTTQGRSDTRGGAPDRVAFHAPNGVGTLRNITFAAQGLACAIPCRRFADILADTCARLGVTH